MRVNQDVVGTGTAQLFVWLAQDASTGLLHAVYHRPNGWDHIPKGRKVPCGESCMWGDYHARELALLLGRMARKEPYYAFFGS